MAMEVSNKLAGMIGEAAARQNAKLMPGDGRNIPPHVKNPNLKMVAAMAKDMHKDALDRNECLFELGVENGKQWAADCADKEAIEAVRTYALDAVYTFLNSICNEIGIHENSDRANKLRLALIGDFGPEQGQIPMTALDPDSGMIGVQSGGAALVDGFIDGVFSATEE